MQSDGIGQIDMSVFDRSIEDCINNNDIEGVKKLIKMGESPNAIIRDQKMSKLIPKEPGWDCLRTFKDSEPKKNEPSSENFYGDLDKQSPLVYKSPHDGPIVYLSDIPTTEQLRDLVSRKNTIKFHLSLCDKIPEMISDYFIKEDEEMCLGLLKYAVLDNYNTIYMPSQFCCAVRTLMQQGNSII